MSNLSFEELAALHAVAKALAQPWDLRDQLEQVLQERQADKAAAGTRLWAITPQSNTATDELGLTDLTTQNPEALQQEMRPTSMAILVQSPPVQ